MKYYLRFSLVLLLSVFLIACGDDDNGDDLKCDPPCEASECEECVEGECVSRCEGDQVCVDGVCVDPVEDCDPPCEAAECEECVEGECVSKCEGDQVCDDGVCRDPEEEYAPFVVGHWEGTALVPEGDFLQPGTFPVDMYIMQSGKHLRGFIDLHQDAGFMAEAFAYNFSGEIDEDGLVVLHLTDRMCGAGDPDGLCYPHLPMLSHVFTMKGGLTEGDFVFDSVSAEPDLGYQPDLPFENMHLSFNDSLEAEETVFEGAWTGYCRMTTSVVYPLPLPMYGNNEMVISKTGETYTMVSFTNEGINIVPDFNDIILPETLVFDPARKRFAFIQLNSVYASWLYAGVMQRGHLSVLLSFNNFDDPYYDYLGGQETPPDPTIISTLDMVGVCNFINPIDG